MKPTLLFLFVFTPLTLGEIETTPTPHVTPENNKTLIWSPLFQATWDAMNSHLGGKPIKITPESEIMTKLDTFKWKPDTVLPTGHWKTWAAEANNEFIKKVNEEASEILGEKGEHFSLNPDREPNSIACFGLLHRNLEFVQPFYRSSKTPMKFGTKDDKVRFFGSTKETSEEFAHSVKVLAYRPIDKSHAIEISCKDTDEKVIVYLPAKPQEIATACQWIRDWRKNDQTSGGLPGNWDDRQIHKGDEIRIPYITLATKSDLTNQLDSFRIYKNNPLISWEISKATQFTLFKLHDKGASVTVQAEIDVEPFGAAPPPTYPRTFFYNRPFYIFLWRDQAEWPYLAVWVADSSLMELVAP